MLREELALIIHPSPVLCLDRSPESLQRYVWKRTKATSHQSALVEGGVQEAEEEMYGTIC